MLMDYEVGMDVLVCANNQKNEELLFQRWMHSFSEKSFEDFKNELGYRPQTNDEESNEEDILNDVKKIMG